jgi:hypothetical protein
MITHTAANALYTAFTILAVAFSLAGILIALGLSRGK